MLNLFISKLLGSKFLIVLVIASAVSGGLFYKSLDLSKKLGEAQAKLDDAVNKNKSLSGTIERLQEEGRLAQVAADEVQKKQANREEVIVKEIIEIKEVLVYEECADVRIPYASIGVYDN